jgi:hypothetical protein
MNYYNNDFADTQVTFVTSITELLLHLAENRSLFSKDNISVFLAALFIAGK